MYQIYPLGTPGAGGGGFFGGVPAKNEHYFGAAPVLLFFSPVINEYVGAAPVLLARCLGYRAGMLLGHKTVATSHGTRSR